MAKKKASSAKRRKKSRSSSTSKKHGTSSAKKPAKKPAKKSKAKKPAKVSKAAKKTSPSKAKKKATKAATRSPSKAKRKVSVGPKRTRKAATTKRTPKLKPKKSASRPKAKRETQAEKLKRLTRELAAAKRKLRTRKPRATGKPRDITPDSPLVTPSGPPTLGPVDEPGAGVVEAPAEHVAPVLELVPRPVDKPRSRGRVYVVLSAEPSAYAEKGSPKDNEGRLRVSGHGNTSTTGFERAFLNAFKGALKRTGYQDIEDAPLYRYGVSFRMRNLEDRDKAATEMQTWLNENLGEKNHSAHIVLEDGALSIKLNFGSVKDATPADEAAADIYDQSKFIKRTFEQAKQYVMDDEDFVWFPFWDWDDMEAY